MMASVSQSRATEDELLHAPDDGYKRELVDGAIRVSPAGARHGAIAIRVASRLLAYVEREGLGHVFDSSTGFRLPGGNVRCPDASVVCRGRFDEEALPVGFSPVPPDLAVEVLSPDDRPRDVLDKVGEYLGAGVRRVWVIDPDRRSATVYRSLGDVTAIGPDGAFDGEDVLPGFRCPLAELLGSP